MKAYRSTLLGFKCQGILKLVIKPFCVYVTSDFLAKSKNGLNKEKQPC